MNEVSGASKIELFSDPLAADITASGKSPSDSHESALIATLPPGSYTAIVGGKNNTSGVALVEAYNLE